MLELLFCTNAEGNPARVGNPAMFFCKTLVQKCVTNRSRERNIYNAAQVHRADFGFAESEFHGCKAMRMNRRTANWPILRFELLSAAKREARQSCQEP